MSEKSPVAPADADPRPTQPRPRRAGLWLGLFGVGTVAAIVVTYLFLGRTPETSREVARGLPAGLSAVGGLDVRAVLQHEWFQKWLNNPFGQRGLEHVEERYGLDLRKVRTVVCGLGVLNGEVHVIAIVTGRLDRERLEERLSGGGGRTEVGGFLAWPVGARDLVSALGVSADAALAPAVAGLPDDRTLVLGSPTLIERWVDGGDTVADDEQLAPLLEAVGERSALWAVAHVSEGLAARLPTIEPGDGVETAPTLAGSTLRYALRLAPKEVTLTFELALADAATAQRLREQWSEADLFLRLRFALTLLGVASGGSGGDLVVEEDKLRFEMTAPLPDVPGL